jgi:hypothetical protein
MSSGPRSSLALVLLLSAILRAGAFECGSCANGGPPPMSPNQLQLGCSGPAATISQIQFASYGTPTGSCGSYHVGSCNAANSTSVVAAACIGRNSCTVFPNTTTFGDPCFGTAKELVVQFACSDGGSGFTECAAGPPAENATVAASVDFSTAVCAGVTVPSLQVGLECMPRRVCACCRFYLACTSPPLEFQVVSQRLLLPWSGPIYSNAWSALANLSAKGLSSTRFVPWIPYAKVRLKLRAGRQD